MLRLDSDNTDAEHAVKPTAKASKTENFAEHVRKLSMSRKSIAVRDRKPSFLKEGGLSLQDEEFNRTMEEAYSIISDTSTSATIIEYSGPPSTIINMITMVHVLTSGHALSSKQVKALIALLEETQITVKAVRGGHDPDKSQDKLIKRLTEMMDLVKPLGKGLTIPPEEILQCSYLRLSQENIRTMEQMLRDQGIDPGIHSHTDVSKLRLREEMDNKATSRDSGAGRPVEVSRSMRPVPIYLTKPGAPVNKARTSRPDYAVTVVEEEENTANMKKYKV